MLRDKHLHDIEKYLNKKIVESRLLSNSFNINCFRILTEDKNKFVVKFYRYKNSNFNAIKSEGKNLEFFNKIKCNYFPKVIFCNNKYLIMSFIENNNKKPNHTQSIFMKCIISIHSFASSNYGFDFNTQIGGVEQNNSKNSDWVKFYGKQRLEYIYDLICKKDPMDKNINDKIELILKKLDNFIPNKPNISLLHGDLWEGNILFNNLKFVGLIDPGSFYGHNELEIAYLRWFNPSFVDYKFLKKYNDYIKLGESYLEYEPIYQLYYSLLNVYLWDRNYVKDVNRLIKKIKI